MTITFVSPKSCVSRRSPIPIADDEAAVLLSPNPDVPRRRQPISRGADDQLKDGIQATLVSASRESLLSSAKAKLLASPIARVPSLLKPSSESNAAKHPPSTIRLASLASEPSSESGAARLIMSPSDRLPAASEPSSHDADDRVISVNQPEAVSALREPNVHGGEAKGVVSPNAALPRTSMDTLNAIKETHRQRNDFIKAEGNLQRQIKAICRRAVGFSTFDPAPERAAKMKLASALFDAVESDAPDENKWIAFDSTVRLRKLRDEAGACRKDLEKQLVRLSKTTHVAEFVESTPGFGYVGLGQIIGEAGRDLAEYPNPAKLWKRMGLGLLHSGERQRCFTDPAKAIEAGYSPRRRSTMYVIGDSMIKAKGPYRELYLNRKAFEVEKAITAGKSVLPAAKIKKAEADVCMSEGHVHIRAQRYMEKRLLRDLWRAWRGQIGDDPRCTTQAA